jgi:hypothetical protein
MLYTGREGMACSSFILATSIGISRLIVNQQSGNGVAKRVANLD